MRGPGGAILGTAPGPIDLARGRTPVRLELVRRGFAPAIQEVVPEGDIVLVIPMRRLGRPAHDPEAPEDPFR